jgi:hypothetical protein
MRTRVFTIILCVTGLLGCIKETYFGKSALKKISFFSLSQQSGSSQIYQDSLLIKVTVSAQADISQLYLDSVLLSSYASISPAPGQLTDFSAPVMYTVTAEDGTTAVYTVLVKKDSPEPQINNAGFDDWYTPAGKNYQEPGLNDNTEWASGNAGVVTLSNANTTPELILPDDFAAKMQTKDLGALGQLTGTRMASGTLFTGKFVLDITNPLNSTRFGIPFTARPKGFTVLYTYQPGTPYKNGSGNVLSKNDSCDIYLLLENKSGTEPKRIATGWFRSGALVNDFTSINVPLVYGALPGGTPAYQYPANGLFGNASDAVTHITVVFASSANGALYEGAVNSTLIVNDLVLKY